MDNVDRDDKDCKSWSMTLLSISEGCGRAPPRRRPRHRLFGTRITLSCGIMSLIYHPMSTCTNQVWQTDI
jgi:hypothetical protein